MIAVFLSVAGNEVLVAAQIGENGIAFLNSGKLC